jgi:hypothetical protein
MSSAAARMRRLRERERAGRVMLTVEFDETQLVETLCQARLIDRMVEPSRTDLERALERLVELVGGVTRNSINS